MKEALSNIILGIKRTTIFKYVKWPLPIISTENGNSNYGRIYEKTFNCKRQSSAGKPRDDPLKKNKTEIL